MDKEQKILLIIPGLNVSSDLQVQMFFFPVFLCG
jgi:hypothetical protein